MAEIPDWCYGLNPITCRRCGATFKMPLPLPVWAVTALMKGFGDEHRDCKQEIEGSHS